MMIEVLKSKLHCVKVTEANLNYMGSITIDEDLMDAANIPHNKPTAETVINPRSQKASQEYIAPDFSIIYLT